MASQVGGDANASQVIDSLGGLRAMLNSAIRELYRRKTDPRFHRDITTRHTITIGSGTGDVPDEVMREFLRKADITDENGAMVTYFDYTADFDSSANFNQLGYLCIQGDTFRYRAPSPDLETYSGELYVTVPSFPELPASMASAITFPTESVIDDLVLFLSQALLGKESYELSGV